MSCQRCTQSRINVSRAEGDLRHAARKAVRRPTDRNLAEVERYKERLATAKRWRDEHEQICDVVEAVAA